MLAMALLIYLLSISLGWHYAIDGLVGAVATYAIWKACAWTLSARSTLPLAVPEPT